MPWPTYAQDRRALVSFRSRFCGLSMCGWQCGNPTRSPAASTIILATLERVIAAHHALSKTQKPHAAPALAQGSSFIALDRVVSQNGELLHHPTRGANHSSTARHSAALSLRVRPVTRTRGRIWRLVRSPTLVRIDFIRPRACVRSIVSASPGIHCRACRRWDRRTCPTAHGCAGERLHARAAVDHPARLFAGGVDHLRHRRRCLRHHIHDLEHDALFLRCARPPTNENRGLRTFASRRRQRDAIKQIPGCGS